ncbi:MAG TPA: Sec-independent protein translocase protein TatB [Rhodanobacteraceae bacterium]|nr:Sec-independent protein translocase protein TatB [Rhodanobacteraceae bacterium]
MIELSFTKLLLVAVIALVVLGPEKLPKAARMAGAMLRRARLGWDSVRSEVERELELEEIRRAAREAAGQAESLRKSAEDNATAAAKSLDALRSEVADTSASPSVPEVAAPATPELTNEGARHGNA